VASYVYDQQWKDERERLAGMSRLWDQGSRKLLSGLGTRGRVLEVGAGAGSVTEWLADQAEHVTAVDVSTRFLAAIERPNVEVLEHDVLAEELPGGYDLVYSRLVAEHLGRPCLERMAAAAAPGGLVVVEDYDWASAGVFPEDPRFGQVLDAVIGLMEQAGYDRFFGRRLPSELRSLGLEDVHAEGRARLVQGGTQDTAFFRLSLESLREPIVASGALTDDQAGEALRLLDDPELVYLSPLMVAAWGRKPS
jgi:SAM-dependent methyltransferase